MALQDADYDVIIVGGGTAGCVIASRLTETKSRRVLLLEAGPDNNADAKVKTPLRSREMFGDANYDWDYRTVPQEHAEGRIFYHTRGRMLGGSSAINSHSLVYPNQAMHDAWAEIAGDGAWSWEQMRCFYGKFQTVQARDKSQDELTPFPTNGPVQASYPRHRNKLQTAWEEAFKALDCFYPGSGIDGQATGGTTTTNAIDGRDGKGERSHAGATYLEAARGRESLTVVTGAHVKKVTFDRVGVVDGVDDGKLRATGVLYEKDGQVVSARAQQEVVLCAGVFGSPQLLEVSGIGDKDVLERAGVQCLLHQPSVGENLQDHLNFGPSVEVLPSITTYDVLRRDPSAAEAARTEYSTHRTGILSEGGAYSFSYWPLQMFDTPAERAALEESLEGVDSGATSLLEAQFDFNKKMLLHPREASATVAMLPTRRYAQPGDSTTGNYVTLVAMLAHPFSRGSSHITSQEASVPPAIDLNYLSHPLDLDILTSQILQIERFLATSQFSQVLQPNGRRFPGNIGHAQRSREDLEQLIRSYSATNYHPCGTCAMASPELGGVVDAQLLVRGVANLRVCDASIFPIIPRGNILSTVYAVAEKGAELIGSST